MDEIKVVNPATLDEPTKEVQPTVTPPVDKKKSDKLLTQAEVDNIIKERLNKQKEAIFKNLGVESVEKAKETFNHYNTLKQENETYKTEIETYRKEKKQRELESKVKALGVDPEFVDYVLLKVENNENFEENVKAFVEANPKIKVDTYIRQSSNPSLTGGKGAVDLTKLSTKEYLEYRKNNPLK